MKKVVLLMVAVLAISAAQAELLLSSADFASLSAFTAKYNWGYPWGNTHNGTAYMTSSQCSLSGGVMTMTANQPGLNGYKYKSGTFWANQLVTVSDTYTSWRVSANLQCPSVTGAWPALWLTHAGAWTHECDIAEYKGSTTCWQNTYDGGWESKGTAVSSPASWHSYRWNGYKKNSTDVTCEYRIDAALKATHTASGMMNQSMWIIVDLQTEGSSGTPGPTSCQMKINTIYVTRE